MADLPILFSAPMVSAILREIEQPGTGKTQTRRVLKPLPRRTIFFDPSTASRDQFHEPSYAVGDRLYVREAWRVSQTHDATAPRDLQSRTMTVMFEAGGSIATHPTGGWVDGFFVDTQEWRPDHWRPADDKIEWAGRFRQGMHLPRWASRLTLIVTDVRVQRLQEISEADARADGALQPWTGLAGSACDDTRTGLSEFEVLWDSLNAERAPWASNPWIAAYTFKPILGNIDQVRP